MRFRTILAVLALALALASIGPAHAEEPTSVSLAQALRLARDLVAPTAWTGVWSVTDTLRVCNGPILAVTAQADTICAGDGFTDDSPFVCTGTVTDDTVDFTCTGQFEVVPGCTQTTTLDFDSVRTGDTFVSTAVMNVTYGAGCLFPDQCQIVASRGVRTAPAPAGCTLAVEPGTWGQIKARYR